MTISPHVIPTADNPAAKREKITKAHVLLRNPIANASFKLSSMQHKVFVEVARMARHSPTDNFYQIVISDFLKKIGSSTKDYGLFRDQVNQMQDIMIYEAKSDLRGSIFATVQGIKKPQSERIDFLEIEISQKLKPFFIDFAHGEFFFFHSKFVNELSSKQSIRLYYLLKSWENKGSFRFNYAKLRDMLDVKPDQYKLFADFKKRTLEKARAELGEKADITFDYELIRRNGNPNEPVHSILFTIRKTGRHFEFSEYELVEDNTQLQLALTTEPDAELITLAHTIEKIGVEELATLAGIYTRTRVLDCLLLAKEENDRGNKIRSLSAYLHNALRNNSAKGKSAVHQDRDRHAHALKTSKKIESAIHQGLDDYRQQHFNELGNHAPQEIKDQFWQKILSRIANKEIKKDHIYDGETPKVDVLRELLGYELNQLSDYQLSVAYMQSLGNPVVKENGFWRYA